MQVVTKVITSNLETILVLGVDVRGANVNNLKAFEVWQGFNPLDCLLDPFALMELGELHGVKLLNVGKNLVDEFLKRRLDLSIHLSGPFDHFGDGAGLLVWWFHIQASLLCMRGRLAL